MRSFMHWGEFTENTLGTNVEDVTEFVLEGNHFTLVTKKDVTDYDGNVWEFSTFQCRDAGKEVVFCSLDGLVKNYEWAHDMEEEYLTTVAT